jgi:hypothetical protein
LALLCLTALLGGCSHFRHSDDASAKSDKAPAGDEIVALHNGSVAVLTPTAAPAHEEDREALAQIFPDLPRSSRTRW